MQFLLGIDSDCGKRREFRIVRKENIEAGAMPHTRLAESLIEMRCFANNTETDTGNRAVQTVIVLIGNHCTLLRNLTFIFS